MPRTWYLSSSRSPRLWIGESVVLDGTTISGIEFQGAWQINDMFTLRGFYELINSKHAPYSTVYCCNPEGFLPEASTITVTDDEGNEHVLNNTGIRDFTGNQLRGSPKHKFSATLTYGVPIASEWGSLDILTILSWRDKMYMDEAELDIYSVPDYTRWDLRANWTSPSGTYSITGWVTNLLDQIAVQAYRQGEGNGVTSPVTGTVTDERRIGITFNYQL